MDVRIEYFEERTGAPPYQFISCGYRYVKLDGTPLTEHELMQHYERQRAQRRDNATSTAGE